MKLRIRHANGMTTFSDINPEQTVAMLKTDILAALELPTDQNIESNVLCLRK